MSGTFPEPKIGADGFEEYDSADFKDEPSEEAAVGEGDVADAGKNGKKPGKTELGEVTVGATEETSEDATDDDAASAADESAVADDKGDEAASDKAKDEYKPNLTYKAYGQEKAMPEWAAKVVTDKASEDEIRTLLSKADGLDEMKPRHQQTIQERDNAQQEVLGVRKDVQRIMALRDTNPVLFFAKIGVSDDAILNMARELVRVRDPEAAPTAYADFNRTRDQAIRLFDQQIETERVNQSSAAAFQTNHQQAMTNALARPDVQSFAQRYDAQYGEGAFLQQVNQHGSYEYQRTKQNISPYQAVQTTLDYLSRGFAQQTPAPAAAGAAGGSQGGVAQPAAKPRPAAMPNLGKGKTVSPAKQKFKNLKALRAHAQKEIAKGD